MSDQQYLRDEQYRDAGNLSARMQLHERYSTNPYKFQRFVFDQLSLPSTAHILELGCGTGALWQQNAERILPGWRIRLADLSIGMLRQAQTNLQSLARSSAYLVTDAQYIAFPEASFHAVIANHMLYHVPDRRKAYSEANRVLRPGGVFLAATNSVNHMGELRAMIRRVKPEALAHLSDPLSHFCLESGQEELSECFSDVAMQRHDDALVVDQAEPLLKYVESMGGLNTAELAQLEKLVAAEIAAKGTLRITKTPGLFTARRRN